MRVKGNIYLELRGGGEILAFAFKRKKQKPKEKRREDTVYHLYSSKLMSLD
jgi:hypothetical protein